MKELLIVLLWTLPLFAQSKIGELRLRVTDPAGLGLKSSVELVSESNQFRQAFHTDETGALDAQRLPFGVYRLEVKRDGFAPVSQSLEIRSAIPRELNIELTVAGLNTSVNVRDQDTLIDSTLSASISGPEPGERLSVSGIPLITNCVWYSEPRGCSTALPS